MNEEIEGNQSPGQEVEPGIAEEVPGAQETVAAEILPEAPASESAAAQEPDVPQPAETITEPEPAVAVKVMVPIKQLIPGSIFEYGGSSYELVAFGILVKNLDTGAVGNIDAGMCVEIKT